MKSFTHGKFKLANSYCKHNNKLINSVDTKFYNATNFEDML